MMNRRPIAVTGALGFLGRWVMTEVRRSGYEAVGLVRAEDGAADSGQVIVDWTDTVRVTNLLREIEPLAVVHCAGVSAHARAANIAMHDLYAANVDLVVRLFECLPAGFDGRVVVVSSAAVYGDASSAVPIAEETPCAPLSHYGVSKALAEEIAMACWRLDGAKTVVGRVFNLLGPSPAKESLIGAILSQVLSTTRGGTVDVELMETRSVRDFIDVADAASALATLAVHGEPGRAYNVCTGIGTSVGDLVEIVGRVLGIKTRVAEREPFATPTVSIGDSIRLRALGWEPNLGVDESVAALLRA